MYELERLRTERGWSQRQLARESGVAQTSISRWELEGRGMPVDKAYAIAQALGCTMQELIPGAPSGAMEVDEDERELVNNYRASSPAGQDLIIQLSRFAARGD